jgi:predicted nuclease of predicted toxin-antitoxin system
VRLLLDQNVPPQAKTWLAAFDADCVHVRDIGMRAVTDVKIIRFAAIDQRIIVTKDADFIGYSRANPSFDVKVIWLRIGNVRNSAFEPWLKANWPKAKALVEDGHSFIELR